MSSPSHLSRNYIPGSVDSSLNNDKTFHFVMSFGETGNIHSVVGLCVLSFSICVLQLSHVLYVTVSTFLSVCLSGLGFRICSLSLYPFFSHSCSLASSWSTPDSFHTCFAGLLTTRDLLRLRVQISVFSATYSLHCNFFVGVFLIGSYLYIWLNQKKDLQWRL